MTGKFVAAFAALLLATLGSAAAQELKPWKLGVIEPKGDAGFILMVGTRGFAEKHGLKLEVVPLKNGAIAHKALLSGELDGVESSPGGTILAGAHGADVKIIGCDWPGVPHGLMVRSTIAKVADLKGKTIAVAAPGSLPNLLINAILEKYKISPSDVRFANLGGDLDRYKAILAGVADAGIVAAEFMAIAPKRRKDAGRGSRCVAELRAALPDRNRQDPGEPARRHDQFRGGGNGRAAFRDDAPRRDHRAHARGHPRQARRPAPGLCL